MALLVCAASPSCGHFSKSFTPILTAAPPAMAVSPAKAANIVHHHNAFMTPRLPAPLQGAPALASTVEGGRGGRAGAGLACLSMPAAAARE